MVLFYLSHIGFLSQMLQLRYSHFEREECVLLLEENALGDSLKAHHSSMERHGLFQRVVTIRTPNVSKMDTEERVREKTIQYYEHFLDTNGLGLEEYSEIIINCGKENFLGLYLVLKNRMFSFLEPVSGVYENLRYFVNEEEKSRSDKKLFHKYKLLTGTDHTVCNKRYLQLKTAVCDKRETQIQSTTCIFSTDELIPEFEIDEVHKRTIFKALSNSLPAAEALVLPASLPAKQNLSQMAALNEYPNCFYYFLKNHPRFFLIDLIFCDLMLLPSQKICIKNHPMSFQGTFRDTFSSDFYILENDLPIEFLFFNGDSSVKKLICSSISAGEKLQQYVSEGAVLHISYNRHQEILLKIYALCYTLIQLELSLDFSLFGVFPAVFHDYFQHGLDFKGKEYTLQGTDERQEERKPSIVVVHQLSPEEQGALCSLLQQSPPSTIFVFLEPTVFLQDEVFQKRDFLQYLLVKEMSKEKMKENTVCPLQQESLYFYCKDTELLGKLAQCTWKKSFHYTGIDLTVATVSPETVPQQQAKVEEEIRTKSILSEEEKYKIRLVSTAPREYQGKELVLWGAGAMGYDCMQVLEQYHLPVKYFCDSNEKRCGTEFHGIPIISPSMLKELCERENNILIQIAVTELFEESVATTLSQMGFSGVKKLRDMQKLFLI